MPIRLPSGSDGIPPAGRYRLSNPANGALTSVVTARPEAETLGFLRWCEDVADAYNDFSNATPTVIYWVSDAGNDSNDGLDGLGLALGLGSTFTVATLTLFKSGGFTNVIAGEKVYLTSGTGVIPGLYTIVTKTDNNNVVLDRTCSTGANLTVLIASSGPVKTLVKVQTLHDAWNGTGVLGIYFRRGGIWRGNTTTTGGTGATESAPKGLTIGHKWNTVQIVVKDYVRSTALGAAAPRLTTFNLMAHASFSKTGLYTNIYEFATANEVAWVRMAGSDGGNDTFIKIDGSGTTATNLTAMDAIPGSWYYDTTANKIYIHALGATDPTVADMFEYGTENSTEGIVVGDINQTFAPKSVRIEGITVEGYGMQGVYNTTPSNYGIHGYMIGTSVGAIVRCTVVYNNRHTCTNTGGGSGGIWFMDNCRTGCCTGDGLCSVGYASSGGQVLVVRDTVFTAGCLYRQLQGVEGSSAMYAHSSGAPDVTLVLAIRCSNLPGQCQITGMLYVDSNAMPTYTTSSNAVAFNLSSSLVFRDPTTFDKSTTPYPNGGGYQVNPWGPGVMYINCRAKMSFPSGGTTSGYTMSTYSWVAPGPLMYNCDFEFDYRINQGLNTGNTSRVGLFNGEGNMVYQIWSSRFAVLNGANSDANILNQYGNGSPRGVIQSSIFTGSPLAQPSGVTIAVSNYNNVAGLIQNAYGGIGSRTDSSKGYSNDASAVELEYVPTGRPASDSPLLVAVASPQKPYGRRLEYDIDGRARNATTTAIGPYEKV